MFHTGSLAEFHEHPLRHLLHNYTAKLTGLPAGYSNDIISGDNTFIDAVQINKTIVTHYLASKMEIWMGLFMKPVYEVDGGQLVFEFAKSRGAIHFHSLLTAKHAVFGNNAKHLQHLSENIHNAMATANDFIRKNYDPQLHKENSPLAQSWKTVQKLAK